MRQPYSPHHTRGDVRAFWTMGEFWSTLREFLFHEKTQLGLTQKISAEGNSTGGLEGISIK